MAFPFDAMRARQQQPIVLGHAVRRNDQLARKGVETILTTLQTNEDQPRNAASSIGALLTFGNRIPLSQAMESLTPFEQRVVEQTQAQPALAISPFTGALPDNSCLVLQERKVGHVSFLVPEEIAAYPLAENHFVAGIIQFQPQEYQSLLQYKKQQEQAFAEQSREGTQALTTMEQNGQLPSVLANVRDNFIRIGPTFFHVGHRIYSTFDQAGKNIIDRKDDGQRLLSVLPKVPVSEWALEDQVYVYGMHVLLSSGGPSRLEELNGGQITPSTLHTFFNKKALLYGQTLATALPEDFVDLPLAVKSHWIGERLPEVNAAFQRFRKINGLMVRQEEHILGRKEYTPNIAVQDTISRQLQTVFGIPLRNGEAAPAYWQRVTQAVITQELAKDPLQDVSPLPLLIWTIVNAAVEATGSDIAMSRSFRSTKKVREEGTLAQEKQDFYCCVVPSHAMMASHEDTQTAKALELIAKRMEFNSWHFFPNDLPLSEIPADRDYFFPPQIPDVATEISHHHAGHVDAVVHHSLRYPSPLTIDGTEIKGAFDIRLMRQEGQQYQPEDIAPAREYVHAMGVVLTTVVASNTPVTVDAFTVPWYRNSLWKQYKKRM